MILSSQEVAALYFDITDAEYKYVSDKTLINALSVKGLIANHPTGISWHCFIDYNLHIVCLKKLQKNKPLSN